MAEKFPSKTWFLEQRPPEVKIINDHTTGLCKVGSLIFIVLTHYLLQMCESTRINFEKFVKEMKKLCSCKTKDCRNWECTCAGKFILCDISDLLSGILSRIICAYLLSVQIMKRLERSQRTVPVLAVIVTIVKPAR